MSMMQAPFPPKSENPLMSYMRNPKIYIRLPSNGLYWEDGSLEKSEDGTYPVFSMTAKDELTMKTPDALLNGQAVVDVIQSCMPNIKDAWKTPTIDIDAILVAIRMATYGEILEVSHTVPNTEETVSHQIDLRILLDQLTNKNDWIEAIQCNAYITCYVRPLTYRHMSNSSLRTFEAQRLIQSASNNEYTEEQKLELYNQSVSMISDLTIDIIADSIVAIETPDTIVRDAGFIKEFLENTDSEIYQKIQDHISNLRESQGLQPVTVQSTEDLIELGAPETYQVPITLDNSDFFVRGS